MMEVIVKPRRNTNTPFTDYFNWIAENNINYTWRVHTNPYRIIFCFGAEEDALAFKLRWS